MTIYFDTETTGLTPGRIIQLSYVIEDDGAITAKNFFFAVDYVPPEVVKIHGFSAEKLAVLSGGKTFSDCADEIALDFQRADVIVAHNVKFDIAFLTAEFSYINEVFKYNLSFDSMKYYTPIIKLPRKSGGYKYPKLSEVADFLEIYTYDVSRKCIELFKEANLSAHDARFDTALLYLCTKDCKIEKNEFDVV